MIKEEKFNVVSLLVLAIKSSVDVHVKQTNKQANR